MFGLHFLTSASAELTCFSEVEEYFIFFIYNWPRSLFYIPSFVHYYHFETYMLRVDSYPLL